MAPLTVNHGERNGDMARTAVSSLEDLGHGVGDLAPFHTAKYVRVAELAPVPYRVLLVGEYNVRHSLKLCPEGKILLRSEGLPLNRDSLEKVHRLDEIILFSLFPVNPVSETFFREILGKGGKVIFRPDILTLGVTSEAPGLLISAVGSGARLKHLFSVHGCPAVMAGTAIVAADVIGRLDPCCSCLHPKPYVNVTEPAGILCAMKPVIEHNRRKACLLGIIVDYHPPVFIR